MTAPEADRRLDVRPVVLQGTHVRLEPLAPEHLDGLMAAGADASIWTWMLVHPRTRDEFAAYLDGALAAAATGSELPFATVAAATGEVLGSTRLLNIEPASRRVEIGWTWLSPRAQRTPVNTECKYLLLRHCFETLGCLRVELKTDGRNGRSRAAIARIGATEEGTLRRHQLTQHGFVRDTVYFSILDDEWPAAKLRLEAMLAR